VLPLQRRLLEEAERFVNYSLVPVVATLLAVPALIFFLGVLNPLLLLYELLAIISLVLIFILRRMLIDYSLDSFYKFSLIAAVLAAITGLGIAGALVLLARERVRRLLKR